MHRSALLRAGTLAAAAALSLVTAAGSAHAATAPTTTAPAGGAHFVPASASPHATSAQGYIMVYGYSRLCLDANAAGIGGNGDTVTIQNCNGGSNQLWTVNYDDSGNETVVNAADGKCLDADAAGLATNGDPIQLWDCTGASNQEWIGGDYYNVASGKYLTALGSTGWVGAQVVLWDELGTYDAPSVEQWWGLYGTY
jgi:hypothetical protein